MIADPRPKFGLNDVLSADCSVPDCRDTTVEAPFPICAAHYAGLIRHFHQTVQGNGYTRDLYGNYEDRIERETQDRRERERVLYFIRFGDLVKIGITSNVARRLSELPHDEVLGVMRGTYKDEAQWHDRFAEHHHQGEWFRCTPYVRSRIEAALAEAAAA